LPAIHFQRCVIFFSSDSYGLDLITYVNKAAPLTGLSAVTHEFDANQLDAQLV
jgi:hypothetical protein